MVPVIVLGTLLAAGLTSGAPADASSPHWTIQATPNQPGNNSQLQGVACSSAKACIAVGYDPKFVEVWNGSQWTIQPTPTPAGATGSQLTGIACASPTACTAIGSYTNSDFQGFELIEHWNGSHWTIQPTPEQANGGLNAIACPSPTECTAVGSNGNPFVEAWNGSHWTIQPTPHLVGGGQLTGVACPTRTACTAVGFSYNKAGTQQYLLAEIWNGSHWTVQTTAPPAGILSQLNAVACPSPTACTAVGETYLVHQGRLIWLVEAWNGSHWTIQPTPTPTGAGSTVPKGVACVSATACTAVGFYSTSGPSGTYLTEAQTWNGSRWTIQPTPNLPGLGMASIFNAVSCPSTTACTAVGHGQANNTWVSLAESRQG
jgi:hypothetical protein